MKWPTHTDYQDAIQAPSICFAEPDLQGGEVVCDVLGLPRVMSGNFACVYEVRSGPSRWAIRCFVRQVPGQQGRYARLGDHLSKLSLPYLVQFDFLMKGILVHGDWYPVVRMQWVEGVPLNVYVDEHVKESPTMAGLAEKWRTLVNALRQHQVAHGDFQHGNVMVTPDGEFRLVDYDGMFVPAFGRGRSPELGHANFQHPRRTPDYYEERLDNFSALVIYLSFIALAKEPQLWEKFYAGDNLILGSADYRNPRNSAALQRLKHSPDEQVQQLAMLVEQCCLMPIAEVPWFEETLVQLEQGTLKQFLDALPPPPATAGGTWLDETGNPQSATGGTTTTRPAGATPSPPAEPAMPRPAGPALSRPSPPAMSRPSPPPAMSRPSPPAGVGQGTRPSILEAGRGGTTFSGTRPSPPPPPQAPVVPGASTATVHIPKESDPAMAFFGVSALLSLAAVVPVLRPWCGLAGAAAGVIAFMRAKPGTTLPKFGGLVSGLLGLCLGILGLMTFFAEKPKATRPTGPTEQDLAVAALQAPATSPTQSVAQPVRPAIPIPPAEAEFKATLLGVLSGHSKSVDSLVFSGDGHSLASGGAETAFKVWDTQAGRLKKDIGGLTDGVAELVFLSDSRTIGLVGLDNVLSYWDSEAASLRSRINTFTNNLWTISLGPDGRTVASGGLDRRVVQVLDAGTAEPKRQLPAHSSWVKFADFSPDGRYLAVGCLDDTLNLWDLTSGGARWSVPTKGNATESVAFAGDGSRLILGADVRQARILDGANGSVLHVLTGHTADVKACAISRDGRWAATAGVDKTVRLWAVKEGRLLQTLSGHTEAVTALAFSANGQMLASGGADRTVRLWSINR